MTRGRNWTAAEKNYLQDQWGNVSIVTLAKKLNRSQAAVMLKASRMGLGAHLQSDSRVTFNELLATIYGYEVGGYTKNKLIQEGIPVKKHKVKNNSFMVIDLDDFWKWVEEDKDRMDFSNFEPYSLGAEPEWVSAKRKIDYDKRQRIGHHNQQWTKLEDQKLKRMLESQRYSYSDIAKELKHSEGAVKRRMHNLGIKLKPPRSPTKMWTKEEEVRLLDMKEAGYDWSQTGEKLDRTALACRGKYERMQNPLYMKRYYRDKRGKYEYNGIKDLSPDQIRKSIQEQNDLAEFETVEAK